MRSLMIMQVHDELVLEVLDAELERVNGAGQDIQCIRFFGWPASLG